MCSKDIQCVNIIIYNRIVYCVHVPCASCMEMHTNRYIHIL